MAACPARRRRIIFQGGCGHVARTANSVTTANMSTIGSTWASIQKPTAISPTLRFFFRSTCLNSLVLYGPRFEKSSLYSQDITKRGPYRTKEFRHVERKKKRSEI